jgi:hypothetical protein
VVGAILYGCPVTKVIGVLGILWIRNAIFDLKLESNASANVLIEPALN